MAWELGLTAAQVLVSHVSYGTTIEHHDLERARRNARDLLDAIDEVEREMFPEHLPKTCRVCQGTGGYWADRWRSCLTCKGTGKVKP